MLFCNANCVLMYLWYFIKLVLYSEIAIRITRTSTSSHLGIVPNAIINIFMNAFYTEVQLFGTPCLNVLMSDLRRPSEHIDDIHMIVVYLLFWIALDYFQRLCFTECLLYTKESNMFKKKNHQITQCSLRPAQAEPRPPPHPPPPPPPPPPAVGNK